MEPLYVGGLMIPIPCISPPPPTSGNMTASHNITILHQYPFGQIFTLICCSSISLPTLFSRFIHLHLFFFFFLIEGVVAMQSFMSFNKKMLIFSEELFWVLQFFFPDSPKNWLAHTSPLKDRLANCQNKLLSLFCCHSC